MIETRLNGQFPPGFTASERINLSQLSRDSGAVPPPANPPLHIQDARPLQAQAASEAAFLDQHGFVLLDAPTAVADWSDGAEVSRIYMAEVEALIRTRLYPGRRLHVAQPPFVVRRGIGTNNPGYATGIHQDHGITADDYAHNIEAFVNAELAARWRAQFAQDDVEGFVSLDFWRTTGMAGPLKHMPLALCDPTSIAAEDVIPTAFEGIAPGGVATHHVGLRYDPDQLWYYYPDMTPSEVLVFKLFQLMRDEEPPRYRACFHSAFEDPTAPPDAPPRQSCEHRVSVMLLKD